MDLLENAMEMANEYADTLGILEIWLDKTEKKIKEMETGPTEEDQIQRRMIMRRYMAILLESSQYLMI